MALVNMKYLLDRAYKEGYAVPAINVSNLETILALFEAGEELKAPVIFQIAPIQVLKQGVSYKELVEIIKLLGNRFNIEYAIHLDHGVDIEDCKEALDAGFTSIMFDGSSLSFLENIKRTREAKELTKGKNISLEGELGHVGGNEGEESDEDSNIIYTDTTLAKEHIEKTGVDCLAVSIGNAHGFYKGKPKLNFQILDEINSTLNIPLVLHGGTGISDKDIKKAITLGISKVNFFTEIDYEFTQGFYKEVKKNKNVYMMAAAKVARENFKAKIKEKIRVTMAEGRLRV